MDSPKPGSSPGALDTPLVSPDPHPGPEPVEPRADSGALKRSLGNRHIVMIALGGIIGAGLFVGSGAVINSTGPAAVLSYALSGVLLIFVIRAIGEMAVARPSSGSVANFARLGLGNWAGFSVGWLYWYFWVIVAAIEAVAGAGILSKYVPVPGWLLCLGLVLLMTGINLLSVKAYGETEFWFASIKILAIVFFICVGALFLLGVGGRSPGVDNLTTSGGFFPMGVMAAVVGSVTVLFSMGGAEIATIAAAESKKPAKYAEKATKQVMHRVFLFYVVSVLLIVAILPWDTSFAGKHISSPFAVALDHIGIPATGVVMEAIVLTAVLSSLNSCLYITSRMLFALSEQGDAPRSLVKVNRRGIPVRAILAGTSVGYIAVIANYFFPDRVFLFLLNSSGAIQLIYYLILVAAQIKLRRRLEQTDPGALKLKMWGFPWLSYASLAWMLVVLGLMAWIPDTRSQLTLSLVSLLAILGCYWVRLRKGPVVADQG
ncbi:amino acid permease [Streptomyces cavernicola]|uniref:Amino acid permease n=1 Tax=Streptomyces cavernicola TaxID=3043613 RepID=A0ABT6S5D8_9ACTN|nr:amino acid permease [Streptomyces sp. B-S-A6]MDI3403304.1 amino acid permease [Streptomyces sp. B-S-A6]